jgi:hypothetical protein
MTVETIEIDQQAFEKSSEWVAKSGQSFEKFWSKNQNRRTGDVAQW